MPHRRVVSRAFFLASAQPFELNLLPIKLLMHISMYRSPEEMRAKLSVHFSGEEGIDAGGVSREWYQVCIFE